MSHFTVIVVGGYIEEQLAPYNENLQVAPHFTPSSGWDLNAGREFAEKAGLDPDNLEDVAKALNQEWPDSEYGVIDGELGRMTTYNPDSQWDWYVIGGRWRGFFPLKEGVEYDESKLGAPGTFALVDGDSTDYKGERRVDMALKSQIDFESARDAAEKTAREFFAKWRNIYERFDKPKGWDEVRDQVDDVDEARKIYGAQPAILEARNHDTGLRLYMECPVDLLGFDENEYVKRSRLSALIPYAIVKDGKWQSRGDMGWFGMSSNEMDQKDWAIKVHELYDSISPDTLLTLVDCHI